MDNRLMKLNNCTTEHLDMLEPEELIMLAIYFKLRKKRKIVRKFWVHPTLSSRLKDGSFYTLFNKLQKDEQNFFEYFHMSTKSFNDLFNVLKDTFQERDTNMRRCIPPMERLAVTVRYLATGCSITKLHDTFRIGTSTISGIISDVCKKIWNCLKDVCFPQSTKDKLLEIASGFNECTDFPNCLGVVTCKSIHVIKSSRNAFHHKIKYKKYSSVDLTIVCDVNYYITHMIISKESSADRTVVPELVSSLKNSDSNTLPYVFVGDAPFDNIEHVVVRPYKGNNFSPKKKAFNNVFSRIQRYSDSTLGLLTNKWKIFNRPFNVSTDLTEDITRACVTLHNFILVRDGFNFEDTLYYQGLYEAAKEYSNSRDHIYVRNMFATYFVERNDSLL